MKSDSDEIFEVHHLLLQEYGDCLWQASDPVDTLVSTILSQNTNDVNRDRAFLQLQARFPTWDAVRNAPLEALVDAVRPAGLAPTKAPRIQGALDQIVEERGEISLDFLSDMPLGDAREWLLGIPGVGPKTAAIVLLFSLGLPAFPVDTHVHRVTRRLGLIPPSTSREKAHILLEQLVPSELYYPFHINLIEHGRAVCHSRKPECAACLLQDYCDYHTSAFPK